MFLLKYLHVVVYKNTLDRYVISTKLSIHKTQLDRIEHYKSIYSYKLVSTYSFKFTVPVLDNTNAHSIQILDINKLDEKFILDFLLKTYPQASYSK